MKLERLVASAKSRILAGDSPTTKEVVQLTSILESQNIFDKPSELSVQVLELLFDSQFPTPDDALLQSVVESVPLRFDSEFETMMLVLILWNYHVPSLSKVVRLLQETDKETSDTLLIIAAVGAQLEYLTTQDKSKLPQALKDVGDGGKWKSQKLQAVFQLMTGIYGQPEVQVERAILIQHAFYWMRQLLPVTFTSAILGEEVNEPDYNLHHWSGQFLYAEVSRVINSVTYKYPDIVRKLKAFDEDAQVGGKAVYKSSVHIRGTLDSVASSMQSMQDVATPEIAEPLLVQLLKLLTDVCYCYPELSRELLAHKRRAFIRTCYDERVLDFAGRARYYIMLGVCAKDTMSAQVIYDYMSGPTSVSSAISWDYLFAALDHYVKEFKLVTAANSEVIRSEDVLLLRSLLFLLTNVVQHCSVARFSMYSNGLVIGKLFNLLVTHVPTDLKASLIEAIAAFLSVDAVAAQDSFTSIALSLWQTIENAEILPASMRGGIVHDLEVCESRERWYSETVAFLGLVGKLLRVPVEPYNLYDTLNFATRQVDVMCLPQLSKYVNFVVDVVFVKSDARLYNDSMQKYSVQSQCLAFMETVLFGQQNEAQLLLAQKLLAGNSQASDKILNLLVQGVARRVSASLVNHALRVLLRLYDLQESVVQKSSSQHIGSVQELMAKNSDSVSALASYFRFDTSGDDETCYLAIVLLSRLQQSPLFSQRLVAIVRHAKDHAKVLEAVKSRIAEEDLVQQFPIVSEVAAPIVSWINLIRFTFVKLITLQSDTGPSLAHLLLGFNVDELGSTELSKKSGFQVLVDIIVDAVQVSDDYDQASFSQWPANLRHPELFADIIQAIYRLCQNVQVIDLTSRYLRYQVGFFKKLVDFVVQPVVYPVEFKDRFVGYQMLQKRYAMLLLAIDLNMSLIQKDAPLSQTIISRLISNANQDFDESVPCGIQVLQTLVGTETQLTVQEPSIRFMKNVNLQPFRFVDEIGSQKFEVAGIATVLHQHLNALSAGGQISNNHELELANTEIKSLVQFLTAKNELAQLSACRSSALQGWKQLFHLCASSTTSQLFQFMTEILNQIKQADLSSQDCTNIVEVVLACSSQPLQCDEFDSFEMCKKLQQCIVIEDHGIIYRGNLYVSLRNVLQSWPDLKIPFSESLAVCICNDLQSGMDTVWKTTAMTVVGTILQRLDKQDLQRFLAVLEGRNVVRSLIGELLSVDDIALSEMFANLQYNATCLFQFQSRMSLLLSIGLVNKDLLLANGVVEALADLKFISASPQGFEESQDDFSDVLQSCFTLVIQLASVISGIGKLKYFIDKQSGKFEKYLNLSQVSLPRLLLIRSIVQLLQQVSIGVFPDLDKLCSSMAVQLLSKDWMSRLQATNEIELSQLSSAADLLPYTFTPSVSYSYNLMESKLILHAKEIVFDIVCLCVGRVARYDKPSLVVSLNEGSLLSLGHIFTLISAVALCHTDGQVVSENVSVALSQPSGILWDDLITLSGGDASVDSGQLRKLAVQKLSVLDQKNTKSLKKARILLEQCLVILRREFKAELGDREEIQANIQEITNRLKDVQDKQFQNFLNWMLPQLQV